MLSLFSHPTEYSFASYSIPAIVKSQTMIHEVCSECLRLQRKAAPMSHLCASGPQFSIVASLKHRTGFHPWSLVICWNNNAWDVINPLLMCRIIEAGDMSVFFPILTVIHLTYLSMCAWNNILNNWVCYLLGKVSPLPPLSNSCMLFSNEVYTWTVSQRERCKSCCEARAVLI